MAFLQGSLMAWRVDALLNAGERAPTQPSIEPHATIRQQQKQSNSCNCVRSIISRTRSYRTPVKDLLVEKSSTMEIPPQSAGLFVLATFIDNQTFPLCH